MQRVWIALELKGIPYQYIEVDPYQKPESLLEVNPRGLVPALRHGDWGCYESTVLVEYVWIHLTQPVIPDTNKFVARGFEYGFTAPPGRPKVACPLSAVDRPCECPGTIESQRCY